jgi:GT2 family glycosyltransferase/predicted negative regulator of RcsB-dependent stress response
MPKFSIIIPVKDNLELTKKCIQSIKNYTTDFEIIIVDNGSQPTYDGSEIIIWNKNNLGFPVAVNQGIKAAQGEVIVILNNDTVVTPGWLDHLAEHLKTFDIIGPVSNNVSGPQKRDYLIYDGQENINKIAAEMYSEKQGRAIPFHRLVFFCVAIKKEVIDKIGLLDEQFSPGNFEDDDFCLRAIEAGFKLGIAQDVFIYHKGSATHKTLNLDYQTLMATNLAKFRQKWPQNRYIELQGRCLDNYYSKQPRRPLGLALMMIVKNEEIGLERAILSVRHLVDEIVIAVDNSSTDETLKIAKKYATVLKCFDWQNDFSAARNFAMEGIKSKWILFLDGHEYLKQEANLVELLETDRDGLLTTIEMDNGSIFRNPRIFRNGIKFVGAVHEQQQLKNAVLATQVIIKHDRIGAQSKQGIDQREIQRDEMLNNIMVNQLKINKKDTRALFHLALHACGKKDYKQAIKYSKKYLKYSKDKGQRWFINYNLAVIYLNKNKYFRAYQSVRACERESGHRWETEKLLGTIFLMQKDYKKAIEFFVDSFMENKGDVSFKPEVRDNAVIWNFIGECFFNLREYFKAGVSFDKAAKYSQDPDFKILLTKRAELMLKIAENQK